MTAHLIKEGKYNLLAAVLSRLVWLYLHFVAITSEIRWANTFKRHRAIGKNKNVIFTFWHGRQVFLAWAYRNTGYKMLVSRSKDGEYIARTLHLFGVQTIRGSSSNGGMRALVELKKTLESGNSIGITPDGPRGPQRTISPGVLFLAQKTHKPVISVSYSAKRKLIFHGWDDFWVPLPFNRIVIGHGDPVSISGEDDLKKKSLELSSEINRVTRETDEICSRSGSCFKEAFIYFLYSSCVTVFLPLILLGVFLRYPKSFVRYFMEGLPMRLGWIDQTAFKGSQKIIWAHASSLGECRAAFPLLRELRRKHPDFRIIFSSTTPNGVAEAKRLGLGETVYYSPLDHPRILKRIFAAVRPDLLLLLESEIWPNWIREASRMGAAVGIVNGRISQKSAARYEKVRWFSEIWMKKVDFVCARDKEDAKRFERIGIPEEKIRVGGNLKFDFFPWDLPDQSQGPYEDFSPPGPGPVWVAGSVREGEEEILLDVFLDLRKKIHDLRLILAPRHMERLDFLKNLLASRSEEMHLKSAIGKNERHWKILIWDTFGDLWRAYEKSDVVFVGGSLVPMGGQNPIEPAWFSKPVFFGPSMENFSEPARILLENQSAIQVNGSKDLSEKMGQLLSDKNKRGEIGRKARKTVESFYGHATRKSMEMIEPFIHE